MNTWIKRQQLLFFGLAILSLITTSTAANSTNEEDRHYHHDDNHNKGQTVHIINGLPKNSESMEISCRSKWMSPEVQRLGAGQAYNWRVKKRELHKCYALWRQNFQIWHAFQPRRDEHRADVYWLVKADGFYLSWDHLNWVRKAIWESE